MTEEAQGRAGQGKATFGAMQCSALQCGVGGLVERRSSGHWTVGGLNKQDVPDAAAWGCLGC